jgi:hypothetical protein
MIPRMTSHELNNILIEANSKLSGVITDIKYLKNDMSKKLKILRYESEYMEYQMADLKRIHKETSKPSVPGQNNKVFVLPDQSLSNSYEQYGCTITPKFKSVPVNVFNIMTTATSEAFYRDIAEVSINNVVKEEYKNILKHDSLKEKELFFEEIDGDNPAMNISIVLDKTKVLGNSLFNMIELDMFLNGSYTIEYIRLFTEDVVNNDEITSKYDEFTNIKEAGKMRLVFNKEYSFNRVDIKIIPKFNTQVNGVMKSPIGIKHIYFYNAKFLSNSYAIAEIESEEFIDKIDNEFTLIKPNESIELNADSENIQFYLSYTTDPSTGEPILSSPQETSKPDNTKTISVNVKKIYAKIPLKILLSSDKNSDVNNQSIIGFVFNISSKIL